MSQRRVQLVLLCEDRQQEVFARHFLKCRGFTGRLRSKICPKGSQSGEQYVRNFYPKEVQAYRQQRNHLSIGLVVLIDADLKTPQERIQQLDLALSENLQQVRQSNEAIAILAPKRNIETWIHYLGGESVNEEERYSKFENNEAFCKPDVKALAEQCRDRALQPSAPPSLQASCRELERLLLLIKE